ncbi:hypothetical protein EVAR_63354_1 [Eumeta japonica]|uniref:Uncharacterized protein n=1 Tax=Eumeta variegata TaxID=151549 RepID=A0A4C2ADU2_EUMVA|nr:hypothetical protein EVAR_63354_1 [Eumeta japonica]
MRNRPDLWSACDDGRAALRRRVTMLLGCCGRWHPAPAAARKHRRFMNAPDSLLIVKTTGPHPDEDRARRVITKYIQTISFVRRMCAVGFEHSRNDNINGNGARPHPPARCDRAISHPSFYFVAGMRRRRRSSIHDACSRRAFSSYYPQVAFLRRFLNCTRQRAAHDNGRRDRSNPNVNETTACAVNRQ